MEEFAKRKGKEGTRGSKTIAEENVKTIQFYRNMILGANGIYFLGMTLVGASYFSTEISMFVLSSLVYIACYQFFSRTGTPLLDAKGGVIDPGLDLNMKDGLAEHAKDLVILTSATQILSLISNYLWCLLLFVPIRGFLMAWTNIISPWLFAAPPPEQDQDSKKAKKMERKMKRMQVR